MGELPMGSINFCCNLMSVMSFNVGFYVYMKISGAKVGGGGVVPVVYV